MISEEEYENLIHSMFDSRIRNTGDEMNVMGLVDFPLAFSVADQMVDFLRQNPDVSISDAVQHACAIMPRDPEHPYLEIGEDDEEDEIEAPEFDD